MPRSTAQAKFGVEGCVMPFPLRGESTVDGFSVYRQVILTWGVCGIHQPSIQKAQRGATD
jgi:hypothetical protein